MRQHISRFIVRRLAALALIFLIPVPAAADDAIMAIDQYKTAKARTLATTYQPVLKQMREEIYHCMPWVGVQKAGTDLLRRMASHQALVADPNVQGFSVVLSWLKPGTGGGAVQPVNETLAFFVDKQTTLNYLAKRVPASELTRRAKFSLFDGVQDMGRLPLEVWEDSFVRTYKVSNYEAPKGQKCSG